MDQWLSPYRDVDLLAPAGIEEVLPPDPLREERTARAISKGYMITAAHPAASQAGARLLHEGGNAVDSVFAAQAILNLVMPQSSGFGGDGALIYWDEAAQRLYAYDGRGMAPLAVDRRIFLNPDGSERALDEVSNSGATILVPGLMSLLGHAHARHGEFPLEQVLGDAIFLSKNGFPLSPALHKEIRKTQVVERENSRSNPIKDALSRQLQIGSLIKNTEFASFLNVIAQCGYGAFYHGPMADSLVQTINHAPGIPGSMSKGDLASYQPKERNTICISYRGYRICGMGPPISGSLSVLQIMGMLEHHPIDKESPDSVAAVQMIAEAARLAIADHDLYVADMDYVDVPSGGLVESRYLAMRAQEFSLGPGPKGDARSGYPPGASNLRYGRQKALPPGTATQIVARDKMGNFALLTSGLETRFGSGHWVHGLPLNSALLGFSKHNTEHGVPVRNRIEPGKRPAASWAPVIVFDPQDRPILALGAAGDDQSALYVARVLVAVLDWGLSLQNAVSLPQFSYADGAIHLEVKSSLAELAVRLRNLGYTVRLQAKKTGLHGISLIQDRGLEGGVDPRGEGMAIGDQNLLKNLREAFELVVPKQNLTEQSKES
ncbi:gamma-glutamyltransferase family protein [Aestuariispira insulae]|uniref:Gamma-glutamyltranspeptidase/glutathione hydrolase n=1 Tax=Aestuariispira insulae TaxID=1461337 RepID=A0A3D9HN43_9PROT|nr:gamma-glutamyltransferase [Aestuariispira insulae]RED50922.1 gamma-glutamyltranspeptidase/glutathione hydrolase [Aestuariispira insulae]